ncbi:unnamed protein product [Hymenolepis diminuta]|uniref:DUF727 domain-containing protein n=1 Tax=Hymenolepis diminuta TaxID=6216 RepID=A0A0R3SEZ2_HYMDI|nr:unnamed protein product [Hymenolepis diminuta]
MYSESFTTSLSDAEKLCTLEAEAAVSETAFGVRDIRIAEALPFSESLAYLNLTTLEGERLCVEISARGFRPVGVDYDDVVSPVPPPKQDNTSPPPTPTEALKFEHYETIYALLSARSAEFRNRFSQRLVERLTQLQQDQQMMDNNPTN